MSSPTAFRMATDGAYTAFKTVNLNGVGGVSYYGGDTGSQLIMGDLTTDNLVRNVEGRNSNFAASNFEFSSDNNQTAGLYGAAYNVIAKANFVLKHINNGVITGAEKNSIEAEVRAIRAMAHFDLVRAYAKIPTQSGDAGNSIGIYYSESFDPTQSGGISRNLTVNQVYDKIIADLQFALNNINVTSADKGRLTKAAIYGLLSRVYLYKGDYNNVISNGQQALGLSPSVTSRSNFTNIWKSTSTDGVLFQVLNSAQENVTVGVAYNQTIGGQIRSEFVVDYNFYNSYASTDIRKSTYFTTGTYSGKTYNNVMKYSTVGGAANVVPIKYLRTAEVVFNMAEAYYKTGNEAQALILLNSIRAERYSPYTPGTETGQALLNAIYNERRLELAFENDRWYTLKRLGLGVQRSGKGHLADGTGTAPIAQTLAASSTKWQWPIPQTAIQQNPDIKQNDGY
ncbi:RagB/SusD family nutrient uptake outer membrane protein [Chryseobacterium sp. LAM-KRS1]|nr:RagB/SusD family nutrient uptake outer membrane protein [Chryseobacterium sp. LAM-KRS1]